MHPEAEKTYEEAGQSLASIRKLQDELAHREEVVIVENVNYKSTLRQAIERLKGEHTATQLNKIAEGDDSVLKVLKRLDMAKLDVSKTKCKISYWEDCYTLQKKKLAQITAETRYGHE